MSKAVKLAKLQKLTKLLDHLKYLKDLKESSRSKRSCSVRPINRTRNVNGYYKVTFLKIKELDPGQFFIHTRMNKNTFGLLLNLVRPEMEASHNTRINTECRLALTLLYLSQGATIQSLAWSWKLGKETVRLIVLETYEAIWTSIGPLYVAKPSQKDYCDIAKDFWEMWNFPNCIGAIDGKHIALTCPPVSGSQYFNYKKFFSIVLMAACDARYIFTHIDVGAYGSQSDGGIFNISDFGKKICAGELDVPPEKNLPGTSLKVPHFFVGDAAFMLTKQLMKPYPGVSLPKPKEIYNKRLSRARRVIENSFGILVSRWRILLTTLNMLPQNAEKVILGCAALHNFLRLNRESSQLYLPPNYVDWEDADHNVYDGSWRSEVQTTIRSIIPSQNRHILGGKQALQMRDQLCSFVNNEGSLDWMIE